VKWVYIVAVGAGVIYIIIVAPEVFTAIFGGIGSLIEGIMGTVEATKGMEIMPK